MTERIELSFEELKKLCYYNWDNHNTLLEHKTAYCGNSSKQNVMDINKRECKYENCPYRKGKGYDRA